MILPVDDCRLSIQRATVTLAFAELDRCVLNVNSLWMAGAMWSVILEQFCNSKTKRFEWLTQRGRISFLISRDGHWGRRIPSD
jgi:hypothetical protein